MPQCANPIRLFEAERTTYLHIADALGLKRLPDLPGGIIRYARHPLVYLVEAADDICYEIMDIEDAHKLRLLSDEQTMELFLAFSSLPSASVCAAVTRPTPMSTTR